MTSCGPRLIRRREDPAGFERHASSVPGWNEDPLKGEFGRRYYPAVFGERVAEASFVETTGEGNDVLLLANVVDGMLGWYGMPLRFFGTEAQLQDERRAKRLIDATLSLAHELGARKVLFASAHGGAFLDALEMAALGRDGQAATRLTAVADLTRTPEEIEGGLRRRFRTHVNWGRRNLATIYVNAGTPDREAFEAYRNLHLRVAGRSTRSDASWDAMFDLLLAGRGELTLSRLADGRLVGATYVAYGRRSAYYASGAYDRELFDKPVSHWPMLDAMLRAKAAGLSSFEIGDVPFPGTVTPKEHAIGHFKAGFVSSLTVTRVWTVPIVPRGEPRS